MEIAVIKTGSKQYKVKSGDEILVELLGKKKADKIEFIDLLNGKKVVAEIVDETRGPKINTIKFKNKTRSTKRNGHRQTFNKIKILDIK